MIGFLYAMRLIPRKRLHEGDWVAKMFTPLAACAYGDGNEVSLFPLPPLIWGLNYARVVLDRGTQWGMWYVGLELGVYGIVAADCSEFGGCGKFNLYY